MTNEDTLNIIIIIIIYNRVTTIYYIFNIRGLFSHYYYINIAAIRYL